MERHQKAERRKGDKVPLLHNSRKGVQQEGEVPQIFQEQRSEERGEIDARPKRKTTFVYNKEGGIQKMLTLIQERTIRNKIREGKLEKGWWEGKE